MTKKELMDRGDDLGEKYTEDELKDALRDAVFMGDNEERLALQWALKQKTGTKDGYKITKEQEDEANKKLTV